MTSERNPIGPSETESRSGLPRTYGRTDELTEKRTDLISHITLRNAHARNRGTSA